MVEEKIPIGREAIKLRRQRIAELNLVVKGNRGWKEAFVEMFPQFDTIEGGKLLTSSTRGNCEDTELLRCYEIFIPWVQENQPEWFVKQFQVSIP